MGTLVQFAPRTADSTARTDVMLHQLGRLFQQRAQATEQLPGALAALVRAGESEFVLKALALWGGGEAEPQDVLALCKSQAARAGIALPVEPSRSFR